MGPHAVKRLLAVILVLCPATTALGWPSWLAPEPPQVPHPSVVRVIAPERDGYSLGSGSLVAMDASHGLVVTNWHVVRDATGPVTVVFPDGFRSGAVLLRTDRDWDLAALAIQRPNVQPLVLSTEPPRPGEVLTIAGYGPGSYRAVAGRCTEYLSPGGNFPYEMVELDAGARNGDSGGPILNTRGELAGVLFGSAFGKTTGSYCGRVRVFLTSTLGDFQRLPGNSAMIAQSTPVAQPTPTTAIAFPAAPMVAVNPDSLRQIPQGRASGSAGLAARPVGPYAVGAQAAGAPPTVTAVSPGATGAGTALPANRPAGSSQVSNPLQSSLPAADLPPTRAEQIKTILAAIGIISILFHGIRLVGATAG